jgi:DNA (cytosine-5)-methyltransferase 1
LADTESNGHQQRIVGNEVRSQCATPCGGKIEGCGRNDTADGCVNDRLADASCTGYEGRERDGSAGAERSSSGHVGECVGACRMGDTIEPGLSFQSRHGNRSDEPGRISTQQSGSVAEASAVVRPGPTNGFWRDADWLVCRDGKWRPVMPGTFPLAHGAPARVGRLRGYGNAINAAAAQAFIESYLAL